MDKDDLSLLAIDSQLHLTTSPEIVQAIAFAARLGWSDRTAYRFVTALIMTDNLRHTDQWGDVLRKIQNLQIAADLAALEVHGQVQGEIE